MSSDINNSIRKTQGAYTRVIIDKNKITKYYLQDDLYIFAKEYIFLRLIEKYNIGLKINNLQFAPKYFCPQLCLTKYDGDLAMLKKKIMFKPTKYKLILAYKIILSLRNIHNLGIVHRDIKTKNILVNLDLCEAAICDFNISTIGDENERMMSTCIQTPAFRAPEVTRKAKLCKYSNKIDIWGLGLALFELFFYMTPYNYKKINSSNIKCSTTPAMLIYETKDKFINHSFDDKIRILNMLPMSYLKKCIGAKPKETIINLYEPNIYNNLINILSHCMDPNPSRRWDIFTLQSYFYTFLCTNDIISSSLVLNYINSSYGSETIDNEKSNMYNYYLDSKELLCKVSKDNLGVLSCESIGHFSTYLGEIYNKNLISKNIKRLTKRLYLGLLIRKDIGKNEYFKSSKFGAFDKIFLCSLIYIACTILDKPLPKFIDLSTNVIELQVKKVLVLSDGKLLNCI